MVPGKAAIHTKLAAVKGSNGLNNSKDSEKASVELKIVSTTETKGVTDSDNDSINAAKPSANYMEQGAKSRTAGQLRSPHAGSSG